MSDLSWGSLHKKLLSLHAAWRGSDDNASAAASNANAMFSGVMTLLQAAIALREAGLNATPGESDAALLFRQLMKAVAEEIVVGSGVGEETTEGGTKGNNKATTLALMWEDLFREHSLKSKSLATMQAAALLNAYRLFANFFGHQIGDVAGGALLPKQWLLLVTGALLRQVHFANDDCDVRTALFAFTEPGAMPVDAHWALLEHLADDGYTVDLERQSMSTLVIDSLLPAEWSYVSALLVMRRSRISTDFFVRRPAYRWLMRRLFTRTISVMSCVQEIFQDVVLKRPHDFSCVCDALISLLPNSFVAVALTSAASLWGTMLFVRRGDDDMQEYLTRAVLSLLSRVGIDRLPLERAAVDGRGVSPAALLSEGIAVYFDAEKRSSRLCGMRVARAFARAMGGEVVFDELVQHELQSAASLVEPAAGPAEPTAAEPTAVPAEPISAEHAPVRQRAHSVASDQSDSSSGGSDLDPYDLDADGTDQQQQRIVSYLRSSLELLQMSEGSAEAYENHRCGLLSVPLIVAQQPLDGAMVCGSIVRELLRMPNAFNMDGFISMHSRALDALLVQYPSQAIAAVSLALASDGLSVGGKLTAICAAVRAALTLSGLERNAVRGVEPAGVVKGAVLDDAADFAATELAALSAMKTTIRRPAMLRQLGTKRVFFRNGFAPVAASFYSVVSAALRRHSYQRGVGEATETMLGSPDKFIARLADSSDAGISEHFNDRSSPGRNELNDVVDSIMVSQCLLAVAGFTRCVLNCREQEQYIVEALRLAAPHLKAADDSIRRSALTASLSAMESYLQLCTEREGAGRARVFQERGALESLSALGRSAAGTGVYTNAVLTKSVGELVDWSVGSLSAEADPQARAAKRAIAQCGVRLFEIMTGDCAEG